MLLITFLFLVQAQDSTIGPVVLDVVSTIQEHVMNASYSVPVTKPVLTKNIRKFYNQCDFSRSRPSPNVWFRSVALGLNSPI